MFVVCRVVGPGNITHINIRDIGSDLLQHCRKADNNNSTFIFIWSMVFIWYLSSKRFIQKDKIIY